MATKQQKQTKQPKKTAQKNTGNQGVGTGIPRELLLAAAKAPKAHCMRCDGSVFSQVFHVKALALPGAPEGAPPLHVPLNVWKCVSCGFVADEPSKLVVHEPIVPVPVPAANQSRGDKNNE